MSSRVLVSCRAVPLLINVPCRAVPYSRKPKHSTLKTRHVNSPVPCLNRAVSLSCRAVRAVFSHDGREVALPFKEFNDFLWLGNGESSLFGSC